jgi:hypothetical protein
VMGTEVGYWAYAPCKVASVADSAGQPKRTSSRSMPFGSIEIRAAGSEIVPEGRPDRDISIGAWKVVDVVSSALVSLVAVSVSKSEVNGCPGPVAVLIVPCGLGMVSVMMIFSAAALHACRSPRHRPKIAIDSLRRALVLLAPSTIDSPFLRPKTCETLREFRAGLDVKPVVTGDTSVNWSAHSDCVRRVAFCVAPPLQADFGAAAVATSLWLNADRPLPSVSVRH